MAYEDRQTEFPLPGDGSGKRKSEIHLPKYFRTEANTKFLSSTLDQLLQPGVAEKLNGYFGRKTATAYTPSDTYVTDISKDREDYQFEPASVITDTLGNVEFFEGYNDLINQVKNFGGVNGNHSNINKEEFYTWDPHINWDKFTNFREYYWLPTGPQTINIVGETKQVTSTYTVSLQDNGDNYSYIFSPDGLTPNPNFKLFRGVTYRFDINAPGVPITFRTQRTLDDAFLIKQGITAQAVESGIIELTLNESTPNEIYYVADNNINIGGLIRVANIEESSFIDVEAEILGKKNYVINNGNASTVEINYSVTNNGSGNYVIADAANPTLTLIKGYTYTFSVNAPGHPFLIKTAQVTGTDSNYSSGVTNNGAEVGTVTFTVPFDAPDILYYNCQFHRSMQGTFLVKERDSIRATELSNGMKIKFVGEVIPAIYSNAEWYVEGVGDKIKLVSDIDVEVSFPVGIDLNVPFDTEDGFDRLPFGSAIGFPRDKDYIVINRSSDDGNFWSRYNRWFHKDVIELAAAINNQPANLDQSARANRPIIEFDANLKLFNFGTRTKSVIDLIDDFSTDAFSDIEGKLGYNIDGVQLRNGMRILFLADTDLLVKGRIFRVEFIKFKGSGTAGQIALRETDDSLPQENENVLVTKGNTYTGSMWFFNGTEWKRAQEKTSVNQPPLFDVYDTAGYSFADTTVYEASNFKGTEIFSYKVGIGNPDPVLGFPLVYRSIDNVGDILFDFDYNFDIAEYQIDTVPQRVSIASGYLRKHIDKNNFVNLGAWTKANSLSSQAVIIQYVNDNTRINYPINCFDQSGFLSDLSVRVFVNNKPVKQGIDYELVLTPDKFKAVKFIKSLKLDDVIEFKCFSNAVKNNNGYYEIASNLEKNPLNEDVVDFTLGEVNDHVSSIVENLQTFTGIFPGPSNLRDIIDLSKYGRKFIKHSSPLNLSVYHLLDRDANLVKSIRYARREYGKFKRQFLEIANSLGYEGPVKEHVDRILSAINKDKINKMPFYFSDMVPYGAAIRSRITIEDPDARFYSLSQSFKYNEINTKAVGVYLNSEQLLYQKDYEFNDEGFLIVTVQKQFGDVIDIYEYESTNGSYVPPTPTKLGLYPKFEPKIYVDSSYNNSVKVIQGHDGSILAAYDDFRDALILELERRIFNNIKVDYNAELFDLNDYVPGAFRNTGFTRSEVDQPIIADFVQWLQLVDEDYTEHKYFDREDSFTFNYSSLRSPTNTALPGWWRGVFNHVYDTDAPHTNPWEMLGFKIRPIWWEEQYGPAPYTSENLLLWEDLEQGIVRIPGQPFKFNLKYARPGLKNFLPVDADGNLLSPSDANICLKYDSLDIKNSFKFGDYSPVELAWRKSSEYPFAILASWAINQPTRLLASGFDRSRQVRNKLGQLVYKDSGRHIRLADIVFPNTADDNTQVLTLGLVNYIAGYMASSVTANFKSYNIRLKSIKNNLAIRLGGFTDKSKFKLILDSRTPLNKGNVFVPEENYRIFLNTSSPLRTINYSGVIIEKREAGFIIRGYDAESPTFTYFEPFKTQRDILINVGGISETFTRWESGQLYREGSNVEFNSAYYKVIQTHTATGVFDVTKFAKLPALPLKGGRAATFSKRFNNFQPIIIPYGTLFKTVQEVVDFLLGYGNWLESNGFRFEYYDGEEKIISNWETSAREFLFWTTQNWGQGTLLALSPAADEINFETEYSIVDNIYDNFYGYSILKADGKKLVEEFSRINRSNPNKFQLRPKNTADGVYAIQVPVIQKEHIILIDNFTVFGDVIYDQPTGYRQERIKVLGYRTADWDGSLNIPGFLYDAANVTDWKQWADYAIGDLVKYKEFYYTANNKIAGADTFNSREWARLPGRPEAGLITNFEYKVNQFADFYDLDSDNFDVTQQKLAQHLIGYQKRSYLENIINDEVSQYKFYQGMIRDKGTKNALTKLFDVLSSNDKESLAFFEEWAIKEGQYGASEGFDEVEFKLDEAKFRNTPQPFELVDSVPGGETDLIYRIRPFEVFKKPLNYDHKPFPVRESSIGYTRDAGYVNQEDVQFIVPTYLDILNIRVTDLFNRKYVWVGTEKQSWNVYQHVLSDYVITKLAGNADAVSIGDPTKNQFTVSLNKAVTDIKVGDIIGLYDLIISTKGAEDSTTVPVVTQETAPVEGFFKVLEVNVNELIIDTNLTISDIDNCRGLLTRLVSARVENINDANILTQGTIEGNDLVWIDNDGVDWRVIKNNQAFGLLQKIQAEETGVSNKFGFSIDVDSRNTVIVVGSPGAPTNGKAFVYTRGANSQNFQFTQIIEPTDNLADLGQRYAESVAVSPDGKFIVTGSPDASNIKTKFRGQYDDQTDYQDGESVLFSDQLWEAVVDIRGADDALEFSSFGSIIEVLQKYNITGGEIKFNNLVTGKYPFKDVETDHILVRAPADQYAGTGPGDTVFLDWYLRTTANQDQLPLTLTARQPFGGTISGFTEANLEDGLVIQKKIDAVIYVETFASLPDIGEQIDATGVFGYVSYIYQDEGAATIYVEGSFGRWQPTGSLFTEIGEFVGEYVRVAPIETLNTSDDLGGYWWFNTASTINVGTVNEDEGRALAVYNVIPNGKADPGAAGGNIYDFNNTVVNSENNINSYIRTLTYQGAPGAYNNLNIIPSDLFVVRAPKSLTDLLSAGDSVKLEVVNLPNYADGGFVDISPIGISYFNTNRTHIIEDVWSGYINFNLDETDTFGNPYEPRVGQFVRDRNTGATGQVTFYQRNGLSATIFVKNVVGSWARGRDFGNTSSIEFIGEPLDPSPVYSVTRRMGEIRSVSLGNASLGIGNLVVFKLPAPIVTVPAQAVIIGAEYIIYRDDPILGIATQANIPSQANFDWRPIYRVSADADGFTVNADNLGMFTVYAREASATFSLVGSFIVPEVQDNLRLGSKVLIRKNNDLYKLFVGCRGNGTSINSGRIYFINYGTTDDGTFYNWELAKNKKYRGEFGPEKEYFIDDIIFLDGLFYQAQTNIAPGLQFNVLDWQRVAYDGLQYTGIDYVGYIPNNTDFVPNSDSSLKLDQEGLLEFGTVFDADERGEVIVVTAIYDNTKPNRVVVYRAINGNYLKSQELLAANNISNFGEAVSVSRDGTLIAVGASLDSVDIDNQGSVYVYRQVNGEFVLDLNNNIGQRLTSVNAARKELFGASLDFDGDTLFVSAHNSYSDEITIFDNHATPIFNYILGIAANGDPIFSTFVLDQESLLNENRTTFDNGFTNFKSKILGNGVVYVYDRIENSLVYGQTLDFNDPEARTFGQTIIAKQNHLYTALTDFTNTGGKIGAVFDFRRSENKRVWETHRVPKKIPNLDKIKRVMIYDNLKNEIITNLDYIDPVQGKIAGIADQEIRYKAVFDPATYNTGSNNVNINKTSTWGSDHIGQLWWDLSTVKFVNPYQSNVIYSTSNWSRLFVGSSIKVYEWVETELTPSQWDELSASDDGPSLGITGKSKYGDNAYVAKRVYDSIAQRFTPLNYFWVEDKTTVPEIESRSLSAKTVADFIADPASVGHKFISFISEDTFALWNCGSLIKGTDCVLNVQYWTSSDENSNIHNQYRILTEGLGSSKPSTDTERKWFDSLVGYDEQSRPVPNPNLSPRERYGILNKPRQSWFVNRTEALKQFIERTNLILRSNLIAESRDISDLLQNDARPTEISRLYDTVVDTEIDLQFVGVARAQRAVLTPIVEDGKITRVDIVQRGRGYKVAPTFEILGTGTGAEIELTINNLGQVVSATVLDTGNNYKPNTQIIVRRFNVLVNSDASIRGKWAIYERINETRDWNRIISQSYDTTAYWEYLDWYADGYTEFTEIDFVIDQSFSLQTLDDDLGDVVKILTVGTGGWLLLEKIDDQDTVDYTVNYKTIGKQNGTIQFKSDLYNLQNSQVGFDSQSYDTKFFDSQPIEEVRIILNTIRNKIFTDDLEVEYNKLFFASLRYVFSEQGYVDWAFKTSFVKARHNVGNLKEKITFQNDNLESYEEYLREVKPYKTKLREYLSTYDKMESSSSVVTDFDLPPAYDPIRKTISPVSVKVINGILVGDSVNSYPNRYWLENATYQVVTVGISDPGEGYITAPVIEIESESGSGATAAASLGPNGTIASVTITNPGSGYLTVPRVTINGATRTGGRSAVLAAEIGNSLVRNIHSVVKFDRISGSFLITQLNQSERFVGTGSKTQFDLKYPMDMRTNTIEITVNGVVVLGSQYTYENVLDRNNGYDRYNGRINFVLPPDNLREIIVSYKKSIRLLSAADRINLFYNPETGQIGKDIAQLMDGVDYGGVEVKSYGFVGPEGWDSDRWYDTAWDLFDENFDEESFETDGSTLTFQLSKPLARDVEYNVYINNVRVDDNNYDGTTSVNNLVNKQAFMAPIIGNGTTDTFTFENEIGYRTFLEQNSVSGQDNPPAEIVTIRRSTSDGSRELNAESFDTALVGGDLAYTTARGIKAEEITVDGDGFVTPTTSKGPEEVVPGQIMDTLDITVFERPVGGSSIMYSSNHRGDGVTTEFFMQGIPFSFSSMLVKVDYQILSQQSDFRIDWNRKSIVFYQTPIAGAEIHLLAMGLSGDNILDYDEFTANGSVSEFLTNVRWTDDVKGYITVNGEVKAFELFESTSSYAVAGNVVIKFVQPPLAGTKVQFALFESSAVTFSQVTVDEFKADGSSTAYQISQAPFNQEPVQFYTLVTVNNKVLNAGYTQRFEVTGTREYQLRKWQVPVGTVTGDKIDVYLNGRKLSFLQEWTYEGAGSFNPAIAADAQPGSTIILNRGIGIAGDVLRVHLIADGEYRFGYFEIGEDSSDTFVGTPDTIYFDETYAAGADIRVYQFSNHDSQGIERQKFDVVERTQMSEGSEGYYEYRTLKNGLIRLREQAVDVAYIWVSVNGTLLTPTADYVLLENKRYIKMITPLADNDVVDIIHFSNPPVSSKFGWRIFKDMLNRYHYKRLGSGINYVLAEPLRYFDKIITLETAESLPTPALSSRIPGVIFINGERIEYFRRDGNVLKQIRRGTLGTGVKTIHSAGDSVYNQSIDANIPYKDEVVTFEASAGTYKDMSVDYASIGAVTVDSITYTANNNSAFPLGYEELDNLGLGLRQKCVVKGSGFRSVVKVIMQGSLADENNQTDVELITEYISDTEIRFQPPAMAVGAYDLVIVNPTETDPFLIPATSILVPKAIKYLQLLLPFAPLPNPRTETGWYKELTEISVANMIPGRYYTVNKIGNTRWNQVGGAGVVGFDFTATATGSGTGTVYDYSSIPFEYWEGMDIDVLISGRRLRKNPLTVWDPTVGQDSPSGDITLEAEYAVNRVLGTYVRFTNPPAAGTKIIVQKRTGLLWNEPGVPMGQSSTEIATFLREKTIDLPR